MNTHFLPISSQEMQQRGIRQFDIILVSGDAYVDHPSYGIAVIGRFLEHHGFSVGIISQPNWKSADDFKKLGKPRLFFGVSSGNVDSMIANYTANKRPRHSDEYSPGGKHGLRPDRALIVYANRLRESFDCTPIVLGGIEASLRRLAHYDYRDNAVRRSVLIDSKADMLVYGMGEKQILEIAKRLDKDETITSLNDIRGTVIVRKTSDFLQSRVELPSFEEARDNKKKFNLAFKLFYEQMNPFAAKPIVQKHDMRLVIQLPPPLPLSTAELDLIYALAYTRQSHPSYTAYGGIPGLESVKFSIISHRGCCGECSFCSLSAHQGRIIQSRSAQSIIKEATLIAQRKDFRGTITDIGGPTANLYQAECRLWKTRGYCDDKQCIMPQQCKNLNLGYKQSIELYRTIRKIPCVKHVFIGSGLRYDLLTDKFSQDYLEEICNYHIGGQIKIAPEHSVDNVLRLMNKPPFSTYSKFVDRFYLTTKKLKKNLYIVNYFIASHPGATLRDSLNLALYLGKKGMAPEQVQDFIPLPMTLASCLYWTETHPFTGQKVYVATNFSERKMQRALIQHKNPLNKKLVLEALRVLGVPHLGKTLLKSTRMDKAGDGSFD